MEEHARLVKENASLRIEEQVECRDQKFLDIDFMLFEVRTLFS